MEIKNDKKKKVTMIAIITLAVLLVVGGTYAAWSIFYTSDANVITSGQASMKFKETNVIEINNALPMNDNDGKVQTNYFDFSVSTYIKTSADDNVGQRAIYDVIAEPLAIDTTTYTAFTNDQIKVYLTKVNSDASETIVLEPTTIANLNSYLLETHEEEYKNNKSEQTINYRLRSWVDFNVDASNWNAEAQKHSYKFRVNINGKRGSNVITGITIQTPPTKTTYIEGQTFNTNGMIVVANYNDGTTGRVTDYTVTLDRALQQTDTGVTITYQNKVATQNINVGSRIAVENIISKVGTDGLVAITHPADNTLQLGATTDITEYRYQGANPNNYVNFNGEDGDYRIIGVFPTDDGTGNIANRIKLIKTTNYGNDYWNNSNGDYSTNRWGEASLKTTLNSTYYNSLTNKNLIDNVKYYLGGYNQFDSGTYTKETMYQYERKIENGDCEINVDNYIAEGECYYHPGNPTSWTGQIGLMYLSDYMYGTGECNQSSGWGYNATECKSTNWLLYLGDTEWTITEYSSRIYYAYFVYPNGLVLDNIVDNFSYAVRPVQYLSSEAVITGGTGTIENPYTFGSVE